MVNNALRDILFHHYYSNAICLKQGKVSFYFSGTMQTCSKIKWTDPVKTGKYYTKPRWKGVSYLQYIEGRVGRSLQAWPHLRDSQITRQSANEGGKVSALHTSRLYLSKNIPWTHFRVRLNRFQGCKNYGNKYSNEITGNRTRYLPVCSAVPQPTAPRRTPSGEELV
jgi:hypothetical protein